MKITHTFQTLTGQPLVGYLEWLNGDDPTPAFAASLEAALRRLVNRHLAQYESILLDTDEIALCDDATGLGLPVDPEEFEEFKTRLNEDLESLIESIQG